MPSRSPSSPEELRAEEQRKREAEARVQALIDWLNESVVKLNAYDTGRSYESEKGFTANTLYRLPYGESTPEKALNVTWKEGTVHVSFVTFGIRERGIEAVLKFRGGDLAFVAPLMDSKTNPREMWCDLQYVKWGQYASDGPFYVLSFQKA